MYRYRFRWVFYGTFQIRSIFFNINVCTLDLGQFAPVDEVGDRVDGAYGGHRWSCQLPSCTFKGPVDLP